MHVHPKLHCSIHTIFVELVKIGIKLHIDCSVIATVDQYLYRWYCVVLLVCHIAEKVSSKVESLQNNRRQALKPVHVAFLDQRVIVIQTKEVPFYRLLWFRTR